MTLVVDASLVVASFADRYEIGTWARSVMSGQRLIAPYFMAAEAANILRRAEIRGELSREMALLAFSNLLALRVQLFAFRPFAERIWELRGSVTTYDAWYVALAETTGAGLATLDGRLARAPGPRCPFVTPPL